MSTTDNDLKIAEVPLNYARMTVRDLVQRAYDAGREDAAVPKPTAKEVNEAITAVERGAVRLAHARMEAVAKACGFDGLVAALGYLMTLRENPLAELLREGVKLATREPTFESIGEAHNELCEWAERARAVAGDHAPPPPDVEAVEVMKRLTEQEEPDTFRVHDIPVYFWKGLEGRPSLVPNWCSRPVGAEHVVIDYTQAQRPDRIVCRVIESVEPFKLGDSVVIPYNDLLPIGEDWKPLGGAPTSH